MTKERRAYINECSDRQREKEEKNKTKRKEEKKKRMTKERRAYINEFPGRSSNILKLSRLSFFDIQYNDRTLLVPPAIKIYNSLCIALQREIRNTRRKVSEGFKYRINNLIIIIT